MATVPDRTRGTSAYGRAALSSEVAQVEQAAEGFRHMAIFASACHVGELVAGREIDEEVARSFLIDAGRSLTGGRLTGAEVQRQVDQGLKRGKQKPRSAPTTGGRVALRKGSDDATEAVIEWWAAVQSQEWKGRSAGTTLKILAGFALLGATAGKVRLEDSYRELAEASGVSVGTISKHKAKWLPFVRQVRVGNRGTGSRTVWQLVPRASGNSPATPTGEASGLFPDARTLRDPSHDQWYRWSNGWRIYCLLHDDQAWTPSRLTETTGLHPGTVRRILARLEKDGLARKGGDGGWFPVEPETDDPGDEMLKRRRKRHCQERIVYRAWLAGRIEERQRNSEATPMERSAARCDSRRTAEDLAVAA